MSAVDHVTGEVLTACTPDEARALTERMRSTRDELWRLAVESHDRRAWDALGYPTWRDYIEAEVGVKASQAYRLLDHGRTMLALAPAEGLDSPTGERADSPIGERPLPTHESQTRPLGRLDSPEEKAAAWAEAYDVADAEGRAPTASDVAEAVERRKPKTTTTDRVTRTRQQVTEPPTVADGEPEGGVGCSPPSAPDDALDRAFAAGVDPGAEYRKRFTDALARAHDVTQFDVTRAVGDDDGVNRQLVKGLADWCDAYLRASRPTHLRSAK